MSTASQDYMHTRSKSGIAVPKKHFNLLTSVDISLILSNYRSALKDPNWLNAMREEFNALTTQNTWLLVPRPAGVNVVTGNWIFRHKYNSDGSLASYKACWVVRRFTQQHSVDYEETFSPVIKPSTIRVVLSIATSKDWSIHQLDVKMPFSMVTSLNMFMLGNRLVLCLPLIQILCANSTNLYMVLNKPLTLGLFGSYRFYPNSVFVVPNQIHRYLFFIVATPPPIFFYALMILFLLTATHLF
jgi:hypothetical protein